MKIYALMENTPYCVGFAAEHGLSLYIETERHKLLFDMGQTGAFAGNAIELGIDLSQVDLAVLSHGHYDHGGGLLRFLEQNDHAPVYVSEHAFDSCYHGTKRYIGLDQGLEGLERLVRTKDAFRIDEELLLCTCNEKEYVYPLDPAGLTVEREGNFVPDPFFHEQYLVIQEKGKRVVISGCSHKGVRNIVEWLRPDVLVGGFHLMEQQVSEGKNSRLDETAEALLQYPAVYYTCHCTGQKQYEYLKGKLGERLRYLASGQMIEL